MRHEKLGTALAAIVAAVAVLNTLSAVSMPVPGRKADLAVVVLWIVLLALHAAAYRFGSRIRERFNLPTYAGAQAVLLFALAVSGAPAPVTLGLFMACTAELVTLAGPRWGTIPITIGAITLFVLAALITSDLYRATTAGMLLAVTGLLAHAIAGLFFRPVPAPVAASQSDGTLSPREIEVLRELVGGARSSAIAQRLGISERTVKAHLGSIYQKLGVDSRSAAVAAAIQRRLV